MTFEAFESGREALGDCISGTYRRYNFFVSGPARRISGVPAADIPPLIFHGLSTKELIVFPHPIAFILVSLERVIGACPYGDNPVATPNSCLP